jgi:hypothetical protein
LKRPQDEPPGAVLFAKESRLQVAPRGLGNHIDLHAAARHGSLEALAWRDDKLTAHGHRRRAPSRDNGCEHDSAELIKPAAGDVDRAVLWLPLQTEHAHDLVAGKLLHGVGQAAPLSTHALIRMPKSFCVPGTGSRPAPGCQPQPTSESSAM